MKSVARKVSLLGEFAVGKTSTVSRAVRNTFSEKYLSTVGVKVDSKSIEMPGSTVLRLVLWDIAGTNSIDQVRSSYVGGSHGLLLAADGTRMETVEGALRLREQAFRMLQRELPSILILNKCDKPEEWEIPQARMRELANQLPVFSTSAKTGVGVEEAFAELAKSVV